MSDYKYLGFYLDEFLQYKVGINNLVESASRATGAIIAKFKDLQNVHFTIFSKLYETGVIPILEYASEFGVLLNIIIATKCNIRLFVIFKGFIDLHLSLA